MRSSFKHMAVRIISITIIVTIIGVYVYTSYFHYYEGRNNKQNEAAKRVYDVTSSTLKNIDITYDDHVLSSNPKISVDVSECELYRSLCVSLLLYDIDLNKQVYYIEIRDGQLHKVIYSSWEYSGYVGSYPEYNSTCYPYHLLVSNAYDDFNENQ